MGEILEKRLRESGFDTTEANKNHQFVDVVNTVIAIDKDHSFQNPLLRSSSSISDHGEKMHDIIQNRASIPFQTLKRPPASFVSIVKDVMSNSKMETAPSETKVPGMQRLQRKKTKGSRNRKDEEQALKEMRASRQMTYLSKVTHFSRAEVASLVKIFQAFTSRSKTPGLMDRQLFREVFQIHFGIMDDVMLDNIFFYFDADREGTISETEWVRNLSTILRGTIHEHINFCYEVYKSGSSGATEDGIRKTHIVSMLQGSLVSLDAEDDHSNEHDLADIAMRNLTRGHQYGNITLETFTKAVLSNPLNLQALGMCLPDVRRMKTFMALFAENYYNYRTNYSIPNDSSFKGKKFWITMHN